MSAFMSVCRTASEYAVFQDKLITGWGPLQWLRARTEPLLMAPSAVWYLVLIDLAQWACVPAQGWGSFASGHYLSSPFSWGSGACAAWTREHGFGRDLKQKENPLGGGAEANLCESCKTCMCLVTNLNIQAGGGLGTEREKCLADVTLQPSPFPETQQLAEWQLSRSCQRHVKLHGNKPKLSSLTGCVESSSCVRNLRWYDTFHKAENTCWCE